MILMNCKLFGLDLMINGTHRFLIFLGFIIIVCIISHLMARTNPDFPNFK